MLVEVAVDDLAVLALQIGADREDDTLVDLVEVDHLEGHFIAHLEVIGGLLDVLLAQFAQGHEGIDAQRQGDDHAFVDQADDLAGGFGADRVFGFERIPGVVFHLLVSQGDAAVFLVDVQDDHFDFLALLQHLTGMAHLAGPRKIRNVHQAVHSFFQFDEGAEGGQVADDAGVAAVDGEFELDVFPGIGSELLETQGDLAFLGIDIEQHDLDLLPFIEQLGGIFHVVGPAHFGDVDQAFDPVLQLDERAVVGQADHFTFDFFTHGIPLFDVFPGVGLELLETQGDTGFLLVEIEDHDVDFLIEIHHLAGVAHPAPGEVGNVQQAVDTAEVDKHTEVGDVLDHAAANLAFFEGREDFLALAFQLFLDDDTARDDDVLPHLVDLDDLDRNGTADEGVEVADRLDIHLRTGQEGVDAVQVDHEPALDAADDAAVDDLVIVVLVHEAFPGAQEVDLAAGHQHVAVGVFGRFQEELDLVPFAVLLDVDKFLDGDQAFTLEAHINHHVGRSDFQNAPGDDFLFLELREAGLIEIAQLFFTRLGNGLHPLNVFEGDNLAGLEVLCRHGVGCWGRSGGFRLNIRGFSRGLFNIITH